jgi:hypothetical protein
MALSGKTIFDLEPTIEGLTTNNSFFGVFQSGGTLTENGTYRADLSDIFRAQILFDRKLYPSLTKDSLEYVSAENAPTSFDSVVSSWTNVLKSFTNGGYGSPFTGNTEGESSAEFNYGMMRTMYVSQATATHINNAGNTDLFSATTNSFGSRALSANFFTSSNLYKSKTLKITAYGRFVSSGTHTIDYSIYFGSTELIYSYLGPVNIATNDDSWHLELKLSISNSQMRAVGQFDVVSSSNGNVKTYPFFNATIQDVSGITGGNIQMIVNDADSNVDQWYCDYCEFTLLN